MKPKEIKLQKNFMENAIQFSIILKIVRRLSL